MLLLIVVITVSALSKAVLEGVGEDNPARCATPSTRRPEIHFDGSRITRNWKYLNLYFVLFLQYIKRYTNIHDQ